MPPALHQRPYLDEAVLLKIRSRHGVRHAAAAQTHLR